jgi:hypothetical protein
MDAIVNMPEVNRYMLYISACQVYLMRESSKIEAGGTGEVRNPFTRLEDGW